MPFTENSIDVSMTPLISDMVKDISCGSQAEYVEGKGSITVPIGPPVGTQNSQQVSSTLGGQRSGVSSEWTHTLTVSPPTIVNGIAETST